MRPAQSPKSPPPARSLPAAAADAPAAEPARSRRARRRRDRSLQPTGLGAKGVLFWTMLVTAFYVAPYINLFFLLIAFLTVLGPLAAGWTWRNLIGVRGEMLPVAPFAAGDGASATIRLLAGRRARFQLCCLLDLGDRLLPLADVAALQHERLVEGHLPPLPRGVHPVHGAWLESIYPLGVVRGRQRIAAPAHLIVHPAPAQLSSHDVRGVLAELGGASLTRAMDMGPAGLREYREGDELRWVHWRASARRRQLVVKEWDTLAHAGVEVQLDRRADVATFEVALSLVTALALLAHEQQEPFTLHAQGHTGTYGAGGHDPLDDLLTWLAEVQPLPLSAPPPPPVAQSVLRLPLCGSVAPALPAALPADAGTAAGAVGSAGPVGAAGAVSEADTAGAHATLASADAQVTAITRGEA